MRIEIGVIMLCFWKIMMVMTTKVTLTVMVMMMTVSMTVMAMMMTGTMKVMGMKMIVIEKNDDEDGSHTVPVGCWLATGVNEGVEIFMDSSSSSSSPSSSSSSSLSSPSFSYSFSSSSPC